MIAVAWPTRCGCRAGHLYLSWARSALDGRGRDRALSDLRGSRPPFAEPLLSSGEQRVHEVRERVPFEPGDRPDLDALEASQSRGSRIMIKVLVAWVLISVAVIGVTGAFTAFAGHAAAMTGAVAFFMVLVQRSTRRRLGKLRADVATGKKLLIEGLIATKEVTGQGGNSSAPQYFLHIEGERFWVDGQSFADVEEGEHVRFEYLPTSELVLRITKL